MQNQKVNINNLNKTEISEFLKKLSEKGIRERYHSRNDEATKKVKEELLIIKEKGYEKYFLIAWDIVIYAYEKGIFVGPGRSSSPSSVLLYCLNVTDVDPIENGLVFERFINPEINKPFNMSIDIESERIEEILAYVNEQYKDICDNDDECDIFHPMLKVAGQFEMRFISHDVLTVIKETTELLDVPFFDINNINDNDQKVFQTICSGDYSGIYLLEEEPWNSSLLTFIKPKNLAELTKALTLSVPYYYDIIIDIPEIIYQEEVIQMIHDKEGHSLPHSDTIRRERAKKGIHVYTYNKAHMVCYARLVYQTAYLKTYFPEELKKVLETRPHYQEQNNKIKMVSEYN